MAWQSLQNATIWDSSAGSIVGGGESSGENAWKMIMETGGYDKDRSAAEFADLFYEVKFYQDRLKEYGFKDVELAKYPGGTSWDAVKGELWEVTPILGLVFGDLDGIAPGYKGSLGWKSLQLYSEGEYVFDFAGSEGDFFYNWSELTVSPAEWVRLGILTQRTRAYETDRDIQRGLMAGFTFGAATATAYVMNPDDDPTVIVSVAVEF